MRRLAASTVLMAIALFAVPTVAAAATGGAGAPDVPPTNIGGSPAGSTILCTDQVPAAGGTVGCSGISVTVGTTPDGVQVAFTSATGPSCSVTPAIGVSFYDPVTGVAYAGTFSTPSTVSYTNSAVTAGETVLIYNSSTATYSAAPAGNVTAASTTAGAVHLTVSGSASFTVQQAGACSSSITGASLAFTGEPFLGEGLLAGLLLLMGLGGLLVVVRRRPRNA